MKETQMLEILTRIKCLIERSSLDTVKEYVILEIENLQGITEQKCKNTKYFFYDSYCKYCSNENCTGKSKNHYN